MSSPQSSACLLLWEPRLRIGASLRNKISAVELLWWLSFRVLKATLKAK